MNFQLLVQCCQLIASFATIGVFIFAIRAFARNNHPQLRILDCSGSYQTSVFENDGRGFYCFQIDLRNEGIPIREMEVRIVFKKINGPGGNHAVSFYRAKPGEVFEKGMVGTFKMKSYEWEKHKHNPFAEVTNIHRQKVAIEIRSHDYICQRFSTVSSLRSFKKRWNAIAYRVSYLLSRNRDGFIQMFPMPKFIDLNQAITNYVEGVNGEDEGTERSSDGIKTKVV